MSFNVQLKAEGNVITVEVVSGTVPDGRFTLWGKSDGLTEQLGIGRREADGTFAGMASHEHRVAQPKDQGPATAADGYQKAGGVADGGQADS